MKAECLFYWSWEFNINKTAGNSDVPLPGILLKLSEFPEIFLLENENTLEEESDDKYFISDLESNDSSEFWSESEDENETDEFVQEKSKTGRLFKPLDDLAQLTY